MTFFSTAAGSIACAVTMVLAAGDPTGIYAGPTRSDARAPMALPPVTRTVPVLPKSHAAPAEDAARRTGQRR
jgi:hypothetical protein